MTNALTPQTISAGVLAALIGFAASFAIVIAGLTAVGASEAQAVSGLAALNITTGIASLVLAIRFKMPMAVAWSTPGAALLATLAVPEGGYAEATGAFVVSSLMILVTGLVPRLRQWVEAIPLSLSSAMLAGVLINICLVPFTTVAAMPLIAGPVVLVWFVVNLTRKLWALPAAVITAGVVCAWGGYVPEQVQWQISEPVWVTPVFSWASTIGIALPLFLVTMTSQNLAGLAVLKANGYRPPLSPALRLTGLLSVLNAPFGGHHINLAALTAALCANEDVHPDPGKRYGAVIAAGLVFIVMGLGTSVMMQYALAAPDNLIETIGGLALLGALLGAVVQAFDAPASRESALLCFLITASGIAIAGIGSAFWGLLVGGLVFKLRAGRA